VIDFELEMTTLGVEQGLRELEIQNEEIEEDFPETETPLTEAHLTKLTKLIVRNRVELLSAFKESRNPAATTAAREKSASDVYSEMMVSDVSYDKYYGYTKTSSKILFVFTLCVILIGTAGLYAVIAANGLTWMGVSVENVMYYEAMLTVVVAIEIVLLLIGRRIVQKCYLEKKMGAVRL